MAFGETDPSEHRGGAGGGQASVPGKVTFSRREPALEHWGIEPYAELGPDLSKPRGAGGLRNPVLERDRALSKCQSYRRPQGRALDRNRASL